MEIFVDFLKNIFWNKGPDSQWRSNITEIEKSIMDQYNPCFAIGISSLQNFCMLAVIPAKCINE